MSGYCSVDDIWSNFPQLKRAANNSVTDTQVQGWIDMRKTRIRSVLLSRQQFDPDAITLTIDQANFLRALNMDGVVPDMIDSMATTVTLQPGETLLGSAHRKTYEAILLEIQKGIHDQLFQPAIARSSDVEPLFGGIGGAETDPRVTPAQLGQNRFFSKNQRF